MSGRRKRGSKRAMLRKAAKLEEGRHELLTRMQIERRRKERAIEKREAEAALWKYTQPHPRARLDEVATLRTKS